LKDGASLNQRQITALAQILQASRPRLGFECSGLACICSGDADCNDMFGSGVCGDAICLEDDSGGVVCICVR
jgi:hypothetical protein